MTKAEEKAAEAAVRRRVRREISYDVARALRDHLTEARFWTMEGFQTVVDGTVDALAGVAALRTRDAERK